MHATLIPAPADQAPAPKSGTNPRTELARYTTLDEERRIYGQRVDGHVRLTDVGENRSYLIESGIESHAALQALLADYLEQTERHNRCPMAYSLLAGTLEQLAAS